MKLWIKIIAGAIPAAASLLAIFLFSCRRRQQRQRHLISPQTSTDFSDATGKPKFDNLHSGINNLNLSHKSGSSPRKSRRFHHLKVLNHQPPSPRSPQLQFQDAFRWDEHPHLITEAAENGWQSFAFSNSIPDRLQPPGSLWALCAACDIITQQNSPETGSELPAGSSEFMQSVRLNPSSKKPADAMPSFSCVRTTLPLPGPALGGGSFPQEAYFEITVVFLKQLLSGSRTRDMDRYSDRSKLIRENSDSFNSSTQLANFPADVGKLGKITVALGLTTGASHPSRSMPGTYPGSIGFHSDGSLYLDGKKLAFESEKAEWAAVKRVVGCGFDPKKKKVFFTVDSQLSHVTRCGSEEYSNPLFPILAANVEVSLLVNAGQAPFKYAPANAGRTPNPCFLRQVAGEDGGEQTVGSVDSRELFSVTRLETEWAGHGTRRKNQLSNGSLDDVLDAESDLFEIALQR